MRGADLRENIGNWSFRVCDECGVLLDDARGGQTSDLRGLEVFGGLGTGWTGEGGEI